MSRPRTRAWWVCATGALAGALLCAGCTSGSDGTEILQSSTSVGSPPVAVTGSPGDGGSPSSVTARAASARSETRGSSASSSPPSTVSSLPVASPVRSSPPEPSSAGVCHDPDDPGVVYDCASPPPPTFPGDHAAWTTAITACMADQGWPGVRLDHGDISPASGGAPSPQFGEAALACLQRVGTFDIAHASDAEIAADYRKLRQQWTCLKQQGLPVRPLPSLRSVLHDFHRSHRFTLDPLAGVDRDVGLSYCPAPDIPGMSQPPPTRHLGH